MLIFSGCTLSPQERRTLVISLPDSMVLNGASSTALRTVDPLYRWISAPSSSRAMHSPQAYLSNYQCFGVNVTGAGIGPDPRMNCGPDSTAGIIGGLVALANGAQISLDVPSGPARRIQLFAATSTIGCPSMQELLSQMAESGGHVNGVEQPFLVAETTVDIYNDTEVALDARGYSIATTKPVFDGCGGGGGGLSVPIEGAVTGHLTSFAYAIPTPGPSPFANGLSERTLASPTPANSAQLSLIDTVEPGENALPAWDSGNSLLHSVQGDLSTTGRRAVVQLRWDLTSYDLSKYPVFRVEVQVAGAAPGCSFGNPGVAVGAFTTSNSWDSHGVKSSSSKLSWESYYQAVPSSPLILNEAGKKLVVVNVSSNFFAQGAGCSSQVAIGGARLWLIERPESVSVDLWPAQTTYHPGDQHHVNTQGGIPPYTVTPVNGIYNAATEQYTVPNTVYDDITITDSSVPVKTYVRRIAIAPVTTLDDFSGNSVGRAIAGGPGGLIFSAGNALSPGRGFYDWTVRRSVDGGSNWSTVDSFYLGENAIATAVALDPANGSVYVAGYAYSGSYTRWIVRRSTDGGTSWTSQDDYSYAGFNNSPAGIMIDSAGSIYVTGKVDNGAQPRWLIRKSTDSGVTWANSMDYQEIAGYGASGTAIVVDSEGNLYASGHADDGGGYLRWIVRKSTDSGASWFTTDNWNLDYFHFSSAESLTVNSSGEVFVAGYAVDVSNLKHWIVRKTSDGGTNWSGINDWQMGSGDALATGIRFDSSGNLYVSGQAFSGGVGHWITRKSPDQGQNWTIADDFRIDPSRAAKAWGMGLSSSGSILTIGEGLDGIPQSHWLVRQ